VRNAKRLVQVQMADVCSEVARTTEAHLGVHVGAVHVDLAAVLVNDIANLSLGSDANQKRKQQKAKAQVEPDTRLENTGRRRVGDHGASQMGAMLLCEFGKFVNVDSTLAVNVHFDYFQATHGRRRRVRSVRRSRYDAHLSNDISLSSWQPQDDEDALLTFRWPWPVSCKYFMIVRRPAYSPCAPLKARQLSL
jgi:hypothetical protein